MAADEDDLLFPALDDRRGPALPLDDAAARRMIEAALAPPEATVRAIRPAMGRRRRVLLLVAAALAVAGVAAAAIYASRRAPVAPPSEAPPLSPSQGAPTSLPDQAIEQPATPATAGAPAGTSEPAASATSSAPHAPERAAPRAVDPGALLQRANELRAQKKWREAEAAYRLVLQLAPTSPEAQTARIAAADLRLHQMQDPAGAERLFGKAQEQGGTLSEEAAWGLTETRRAHGDREGELRALQQFLAAYPQSAMAPRARARLGELHQ